MSIVSLMSLPLLMLLVGTFLLVQALRGEMVGDHPFCRRCGFDLFGRSEGSNVCSECGASLAGHKAIRIGKRRRRRGMLWAAALFLLPALLIVGVVGWGSLQNVKWIEHEPFWLVLRQSHSTNPADRDPALAELLRRVSAGDVTGSRLNSLVDEMLAAQANLNQPWLAVRGDIVETVHAAGKLPQDKWMQYVQNSPHLALTARQDVRRGDQIPLRIQDNPGRVGTRGQIGFRMTFRVLPSDLISTSAKQSSEYGTMGGSFSGSGSGSFGQSVKPDPKLVANAPDGPKALHVRLKLDLFDTTNYDDKTKPTATKEIDLNTTWNLVAADAETVKVIDDPSYRQAVESAVKVERLSVSDWDKNYINMGVGLRSPPVPLSYKIILRAADGREWPLGGIYIVGGGNTSWGTGGQVKNFDADVVDVVFRPDLQTALDTVEMKSYWNGEVVVKNVSVIRPAKNDKNK